MRPTGKLPSFRLSQKTTSDVASLLLLSLVGEEIAQNRCARFRHHARHYLGAVIEPRVRGNAIERVASARLGIGRPVYDHGHARLDDGPRAHGAGLERHVKNAVLQPPG